VGTVATPQNSFADFGLTLTNQWPLPADSTGRIPMFYLANGQVHVRLTDATGVVIFDIPNMQVVGQSSGGGGGGGGPGVDPNAIATTGDIKYRMTGETLTGWVKANGQTIGSAMSGANRANSDTQNLFTYLWANCTNAHCPVSTGRGATALADFNANKQITLPDLRGRGLAGLDDMGAAAAGRILAGNVTSGGGDSQTTPGASGGEANHTLTIAELAAHNHALTDPGHKHTITPMRLSGTVNVTGSTNGWLATPAGTAQSTDVGTGTFGGDPAVGTGISIASVGSSTPHNVMNPFLLGSFYIKL
jgi:microcystin-dependent protein